MREILRFAGNVIVAYQAQPLNKNSFSIVVASLLSNPIVIAAAALVVAAIILVAALLLFRSSGKKKKANAAASSDWQRQGQQVPPPGWNQQGSMPGANSWSQPGQQPNAWGAQQQPAGWDAQNPLKATGCRLGRTKPDSATTNSWLGDKRLLNNSPQDGTRKTRLRNNKLLVGDKRLLSNRPSPWDAQSPARQQPAGWGAQGQAPQQSPRGERLAAAVEGTATMGCAASQMHGHSRNRQLHHGTTE